MGRQVPGPRAGQMGFTGFTGLWKDLHCKDMADSPTDSRSRGE